MGNAIAALSGAVRSIAGSRLFRWALALVIVAAATLVAIDVFGGPSTYPLTAVFAKAPGLFPGASVEVLGVPAGTVTSVKNVGNTVVVGMVLRKASSAGLAASFVVVAASVTAVLLLGWRAAVGLALRHSSDV